MPPRNPTESWSESYKPSLHQTQDGSATVSYVVSDPTGVRYEFKVGGTIQGTNAYNPYGRCTSCSANTPFGFEDGYTDANGLIYLVNRYYDPATDQFISVDPLANVTGQPFTYGSDDPANESDPSGLCGQLPPGIAGPFISCAQYLAGRTISSSRLQAYVDELYGHGGSIGDGGSADALRSEAINAGPNWEGDVSSLTHWTKVRNALRGLNRLIKSGKLCDEDQETAENLAQDLNSAQQTALNASTAVSLGLPPGASPDEIDVAAAESEAAAGDAGEAGGAAGDIEGFLGDFGEFG